MVKIAKRLWRGELKRLQKRIEEAKVRGGVSASLFLEAEMNALTDADCFFFYGSRLCPKGMLSVFFPDEEHAEFTVARFIEDKKILQVLFLRALEECKRIGVTDIHTVVNPAWGFSLEEAEGVSFSYDWSEYMLCVKTEALAKLPVGLSEGWELVKEDAKEGDGTLCYRLIRKGTVAAECFIFPVPEAKRVYLFGLKTKEEFRRQGLATLLLCGIARDSVMPEGAVIQLQVSSKNVPAESLYRKLGFRTEEQREYYKTKER